MERREVRRSRRATAPSACRSGGGGGVDYEAGIFGTWGGGESEAFERRGLATERLASVTVV